MCSAFLSVLTFLDPMQGLYGPPIASATHRNMEASLRTYLHEMQKRFSELVIQVFDPDVNYIDHTYSLN